ncbi:MAG: hypothetical protein ACLQJR_07285 [Stellaceae bacterium]
MNAIVLVALKRPYTFVVLAILILLFGGNSAACCSLGATFLSRFARWSSI